MKVIGSNIHISVYDKGDNFGSPINVNIPWLSSDVPRLPSYCNFIFRSLIDLLDVGLEFLIFILKNLQTTTKFLTQGYKYP